MNWSGWREGLAKLDLQAKVVVVLVLVLAPVFLLVSLAVSQITAPVLQREMRVMGLHASRSLAEEILAKRLLAPGKERELEQRILDTFFLQPNVVRVDVVRAVEGGSPVLAASTDDLPLPTSQLGGAIPERPLSFRRGDGDGPGFWEVWAPVRGKKGPSLGAVRMEISLQAAAGLGNAVGKLMAVAGAATLFLLMVGLSYFLRKTIQNDRLLRQANSQNLELSAQLRDAERQLMMKEKLAVMGQLTASFAHEIGTPLNAVGGHLQLLQEEVSREGGRDGWQRRLLIVSEQLEKIEKIVKGFLQSTAKPASQPQLMDVNQVMDKTVAIVAPRIEALGVRVERSLEGELAPLRAVPLDMEQVLLNLLNNSLDSLQSKVRSQAGAVARLEVFSRLRHEGQRDWVELGVLDTGLGISRRNLGKVFDPFFTTKAAGEGTGLGLSICQEIVGKYNGVLDIESREGAWTKVTLRMPYGGTA